MDELFFFKKPLTDFVIFVNIRPVQSLLCLLTKRAARKLDAVIKGQKAMKSHGRKSIVVAAFAAAQLFASQTSLRAETNVLSNTSDKPVKLDEKAGQKPVWLSEISIGIREGYDNNVYLGNRYNTVPASVPIGATVALPKVGSEVTTISPKLGINFIPLLGEQSFLKVLSLTYAPDFVNYSATPSQNYNAHRLSTTIAGGADAFSFKLDESFVDIVGSKVGQVYFASGCNSAYANGTLRERLEQSQDRASLVLKYDQESWFLRPTASLLDYNLNSEQLSATTYPGYQNYSDRYDFNAGADVGYKLQKDFALTAGYRAGHQYQEKYPLAVDAYGQTSSSDYQRFLIGFEGKPTSWLEAKYQGGPDFRNYNDNAPVRKRDAVDYYGEGSLTAKASKDDIITFNYRQWEWVSSTGKVPYFDSTFDLSYKHNFTDKLSAKVGARLLASKYSSGELYSAGNHDHTTALPYYRNDWLYPKKSS
jgi:hypothetical protein